MTAPVLAYKKFYIIKPYGGYNYIKNPAFAAPDFEEDWTADGAGVTIEETATEQRHGAYSMQVNTATGVASSAYYDNVSVTNGLAYTFSCDIKGTAGQSMRLVITNAAHTAKATTTFTATGYWQRVQVNLTATETATDYELWVTRDAVASTAAFYVDGAQFEQATKMSTFIEGYQAGCGWTGAVRNSTSWRDPKSTKGGLLVDLSDYCEIVQVTGLGHGDWNQILTKMTSGGDMYQTHIRKSRNFSIIVDFLGSSLGEIETNRKEVIDLVRPDLLPGQERIIRYQGVDANGYEATNPVDIVCVPLSASMVDTPDLPTYQRAVLNFTIPSGLLDGAYNEGAALDWNADFPAEHIVKRDPEGNWCSGTSSPYTSLITGLNGDVNCMAEGPDGKIYVGGAFTNAGTVAEADVLARWNPITEQWEAVVSVIDSHVQVLAFDANGNLYVGGSFTTANSVTVNRIFKITDLGGTPTVNALGTGLNGNCLSIAIDSNGDVYAGGAFTLAGGVANTARIAKWDGTAWTALSTGLNGVVSALAFAPNGDLYIGGDFTNADGTYGDYLCYWDGTSCNRIGTVELNTGGYVKCLAFGATGHLYAGGYFTNAGGIANADYIAKWNGSQWESLGTGTNGIVYDIVVNSGKVYASGSFTTAGGLTLTDRIAVWSNGAWQPLDIDLPGTAIVRSILPASDGSLYIGGLFSTAGEDPDENATCGIVSDTIATTGVASASANTYPYMQIWGPGTLKSITNYTSGKSVMFDGLTLNAGERISLKFDPLDLQFKSGWSGRGNLMRYVIPGSDYGDFYLNPGTNNISLYMTDSTTDSGAWMAWTPKFWGIDGAVLE